MHVYVHVIYLTLHMYVSPPLPLLPQSSVPLPLHVSPLPTTLMLFLPSQLVNYHCIYRHDIPKYIDPRENQCCGL